MSPGHRRILSMLLLFLPAILLFLSTSGPAHRDWPGTGAFEWFVQRGIDVPLATELPADAGE